MAFNRSMVEKLIFEAVQWMGTANIMLMFKMNRAVFISFFSLFVLTVWPGNILAGYPMSQNKYVITSFLLSVSYDPGHVGLIDNYRIDKTETGYKIMLEATQYKYIKKAGKYVREKSTKTSILNKKSEEVSSFLERLKKEHLVFELKDNQQPTYPLLHPTFYTMQVIDSEGRKHEFKYTVESDNHYDSRYKRLIDAVKQFFESAS
jgi:hypothetical protein